MKRSAALASLSRDHHTALVVARELSRAGPEHAEVAASRFVRFLAVHELAHFALEESVLLPALPDEPQAQVFAARVHEDHDYLRAALRRLQDSPQAASVEFLHALGARLRTHVQMEERELFPYLEDSLDSATLEQIGVRLARGPGEEQNRTGDERTDLCRALVEQVADGLIFADREGLIQVWNAGAEAVFGYAANEVVGRRLDVIITEPLRAAHWAAFDEAIETGQTKSGREPKTTRSVHKDGRDLYLDVSFALVKDHAGEVLGAVAMARDITNRFRVDRDARRRIAELERQVEALSPER